MRVSRFEAALDQAAFAPDAAATDVEHLRSGPVAWQRRMQLIRGAEQSIVISTYYVDCDAYGEQFLDELIAKARQGVEVCVVLDFAASRGMLTRHKKDARDRIIDRMKALEEAGGSIRYFGAAKDQLKQVGAGIHFKSMVFDGKEAIVGGRNVGAAYFTHWSDYDMRLKGPIVEEIAKAQLDLLDETNYGYRQDKPAFAAQKTRLREIAANADIDDGEGKQLHLLLSDPIHVDAPNPITHFLVQAAGQARRSIIASSNFVNPSKELRGALVAAAKRGAEVTLLTTGLQAAEVSAFPYYMSRGHYEEMLAAGIQIYETSTFEHGKMYIVDDEVAGVGSFNLGKPANGSLIEGLVVSQEASDVASVRAALEETKAKSTRVTDGSLHGAKQLLLGWLGRVFDP